MVEKIFIDEITSISNCYFGFKYRGEFVSEGPFILKKRRTDNETSSYHLDADDMKKIYKNFNGIYPNSYSAKEFQAILTPNCYMELMRFRLYQHICIGNMNKIMSIVNPQKGSQNLEFEWTGNRQYTVPSLKFC